MRKSLLLLILFFTSALYVKAQTKSDNAQQIVDYTISAFDSLGKKFILVAMKNNSDEDLLIADCNCWYNNRPELFDGSASYDWGIAIKVYSACGSSFKEIKPDEERKWRFSFAMNDVYDVDLRGKQLKFKYSGVIKNKQGYILKSNKSEMESNIIEL